MGATASTSSLTKDQKTFIAQKLQKIYDEHAGSMDPVELNKMLSAEYNRLSESFNRLNHDDPAHKKKDDGHETSARLKPSLSAPEGSLTMSSKGSTKMNPKTSGNAPTPVGSKGRRRSFDLSNKNLKSGSTKITKEATTEPEVILTKSQEDLAPLADAVGDSWDSVSTQPYCETCKMAFKSMAFLERHVKFSSLHADNEKKAKEAGLAALVSPPKATKKELVTQEEGMHYRLLYSGSKLYWRTQENLDFDIYHHFLAHAIEIIPFHPGKLKEMPRIYCDYEEVVQAVQAHIQEDMTAKVNEAKVNKFENLPNHVHLKEEIELKRIVTYLLQRLQYSDGKCTFTPLSADDPDNFPILEVAPVVLIPIKLTRRRKSSAEEIQQTMTRISSDYKAIDASLEKANQYVDLKATQDKIEYSNKIAMIVYDAAGYISAKPWYANKPASVRRLIRWAERIRRQLCVEKTRAFLDRKGMNIPKGLPRKRSTLTLTSPKKPM
eukprot:gene28526-34435_t